MMIGEVVLPVEYRPDCQARLNAILESMGPLKGKTLLDIGCANGFFMQGFILSGGKSAVGIEPNPQWRKEANMAALGEMAVVPYFERISKMSFDFALYMDLYFHLDPLDNKQYMDFLKKRVKVSFISPSGDGTRTNNQLLLELQKSYTKITPIIKTSYADRMIYRCE